MITVDNKKMEWQVGMTMDHAMAYLKDAQAYAVVRLNGKLVCRPNFSCTLLNDGDVVEPLPLIVGG